MSDEINKIVHHYCSDEYGDTLDEFDDLNVSIIKQSNNQLLIAVTTMYSSPSIDFEGLTKALGYMHYDKYDDISNSGCDTCDYGSSYGYAIRFWN